MLWMCSGGVKHCVLVTAVARCELSKRKARPGNKYTAACVDHSECGLPFSEIGGGSSIGK